MSQEFAIGTWVKLITQPQYLKTADPSPMLRPGNLLQVGQIGQVIDRRPGGFWSVRFEAGAFLMEDQYIEFVESPP
ncbi:MAG: DUF3148 domain-containing protein [Alkalinema sp. RU_4_3]|nr:DUF3148 domain-containing protein [Alkalinema sp. RU_4_3]